jgi:flap endonuclease-1
MGIQFLNRFLKENAPNSIKLTSISDLSGKKIAIDISIYMYKYASENNLIENMYLMLSIFRHYNITPIFVFDGKPPTEKKELLKKRREDKDSAQEEYNNLKTKLDNHDIDYNEKLDILNNMDILKKKFVHICKNDIENIKKLIRAYGATYYDAPGEADELCAMLTIKGKVWGCLSEDMDMFVYGCTRVIRYFSLLNHTIVLYEMKGILEELGITQKELREICVLSGTDYNINNKSQTLYTTLKWFKKFLKEKKKYYENNLGFYDWLIKKYDNIKDIVLLQKIYNMFDLSNNYHIKNFEDIKIKNGPIQKEELMVILKTDGFIFPQK